MKNLVFFFFATLATSILAFSQTTIYSEDFSGSTSLIGTDTWSLPGDWTTYDVDGQFPVLEYSFVTQAWVGREEVGTGNKSAVSVSLYNPLSISNDWMVSPPIPLVDQLYLIWEARVKAPNPFPFFIDYEVWISSSGGTPADFFGSGTLVGPISQEITSWNSHAINLALAGFGLGDTIQIAFRNTSCDNHLTFIDNIELSDRPGIPQNDGAPQRGIRHRFAQVGDTQQVITKLTNPGGLPITSVELNYQVSGGAVITELFTGLSLEPLFGKKELVFSTPFVVTAPVSHEVLIWVSEINGAADENSINDTLMQTLSTISTPPVKSVVLLEFTDASDPYIPNTKIITDTLVAANPAIIPVLAHQSDTLSIMEGVDLSQGYDLFIGAGLMDAYVFDDNNGLNTVYMDSWPQKVYDRFEMPSPVSVSIENAVYNPISRLLSFDVRADFVAEYTGDLRFNAYLLENGVTGVPQSNFYSGAGAHVGHPYYSEPNPDPDFIHNYVLRAVLGGTHGSPGSLPATVSNGSTYSQSFGYTLPAGADFNKWQLVGLVEEYDDDLFYRQIYNAATTSLSLITSTEGKVPAGFTGAYPNPFRDQTRIEFSLENKEEVEVTVYDVMGKRIRSLASGFMNPGSHSLIWRGTDEQGFQVANGVYLISLKGAEVAYTGRVILNR